MTHNSDISKLVYKDHLKLYRSINDALIFLNLTIPHISKEASKFERSLATTKRHYPVIKKGKKITSRRSDLNIAEILIYHSQRGMYENSLISLVSRMEKHLQDCVFHVAKFYPKKLSILSAEKLNIPFEMIVESQDKNEIIHNYIRKKCEDLIFLSPQDYIAKFERILSITIPEELVRGFIEIKATRDLIIHNDGIVNNMYCLKTGTAARGQLGTKIQIDKKYFEHVVTILKKFSGAIIRLVEKTYS